MQRDSMEALAQRDDHKKRQHDGGHPQAKDVVFLSKRREEKVGGRWSHRDIIFSAHLFIICPLLPE